MSKQVAITDLKPSDIARRLSISRSYAHELIKGTKHPSLALAAQIEREFGVMVSEWVARLPASQDAAA